MLPGGNLLLARGDSGGPKTQRQRGPEGPPLVGGPEGRTVLETMVRDDSFTAEKRTRRCSAAETVPLPVMLLGRSLFPIFALVVILGTVVWGPWVSLAITFIWWRIVARFG